MFWTLGLLQSTSTILPYVGPFWPHLGPTWGDLGDLLGPLGAILGPSWALLGASWGPRGPTWGHHGAILASRGAILRRSRVLSLHPCLSALVVVVFRYLGKPRYIAFSSLVSVSRYPHISVTLYPGISVSRYLLLSISHFSITSAILEICFRAFRLARLISVSRYLYDLGHLGDMRSSFEARTLHFDIVVSPCLRSAWRYVFKL